MRRSRGGLSTKVYLLADEAGLPVAFLTTPGQAAEYAQAICLLEGQQTEAVIANKGYNSAKIVAMIEALSATAVIPPRILYKQRNLIERWFNRLKHFRRFGVPGSDLRS